MTDPRWQFTASDYRVAGAVYDDTITGKMLTEAAALRAEVERLEGELDSARAACHEWDALHKKARQQADWNAQQAQDIAHAADTWRQRAEYAEAEIARLTAEQGNYAKSE